MFRDLSVFHAEQVDDGIATRAWRSNAVHMQDDGVSIGKDPEHLAVRFRKVVADPAQVLFQAFGAVFDQRIVLPVGPEISGCRCEVPLIQGELVEFGNEGLFFSSMFLSLMSFTLRWS